VWRPADLPHTTSPPIDTGGPSFTILRI